MRVKVRKKTTIDFHIVKTIGICGKIIPLVFARLLKTNDNKHISQKHETRERELEGEGERERGIEGERKRERERERERERDVAFCTATVNYSKPSFDLRKIM